MIFGMIQCGNLAMKLQSQAEGQVPKFRVGKIVENRI